MTSELTKVKAPSAFRKSQRLLSAAQFKTVFDQVDWRVSSQHFLVLTRTNNDQVMRLGIIVAKKHIRLAVQRNRVKRLIRETFRQQPQPMAGIDAIVLARKGLDSLENPAITQQLERLWVKLHKKVTV